MRYIARKIMSALLFVAIVCIVANGLLTQFTLMHMIGIVGCVAILVLMFLFKLIRKIIFFPIGLLRKVLFKF